MKRTPPSRLAKAKPDAGARGKFYLTYPKKLVREPLIYWVSRKFDVITNIRSASVCEEIGIIALELDGTPEAIVALGFDPQIAGGLLISLPAEQGPALEAEFEARKLFIRRIGRVEEGFGVQVQ